MADKLKEKPESVSGILVMVVAGVLAFYVTKEAPDPLVSVTINARGK